MAITLHYDNFSQFSAPVMIVQGRGGKTKLIEPQETTAYGYRFHLPMTPVLPTVFKFADQDNPDKFEPDHLWRTVSPKNPHLPSELWTRAWHPFVLTSEPQPVEVMPADEVASQIHFAPGAYISESNGRYALGANVLPYGGTLFGLYHPHAAQVYVAGDFNDWQYPSVENADPNRFIPLNLHKGYNGLPNIWLGKVDQAGIDQHYQFYVVYDALAGEDTIPNRLVNDPYTRVFGMDYERNDSKIVAPHHFGWEDGSYKTVRTQDLIIYELHVNGFTQGHADIPTEHQGKFGGVIKRLHEGYFDRVGATALYLMPIAESPSPQGPSSLGYNTSLFMAIERDFGTPNDLRILVNEAHKHGRAVILDMVFNHSANEFNPLWKLILDHPDEYHRAEEGGLYFSGQTPWGNRISTERTETQNMLIDTCKMFLVEYHIDGFRFDATHHYYMDHGFLLRLANDIQQVKPDVTLIAENLPNETDLNRDGYNGYAQWGDLFHDAMKAFLREGQFQGASNDPALLGKIFYFSKELFAAHTNNVVNYTESHDEHSISHEVSSVPELNNPAAKERKSRLGLLATITALGQPMIYMGQEFGIDRARNIGSLEFPQDLDTHPFFLWASALMRLRRRYDGLRLFGYNPIEEGTFEWIAAPWLDERHGGGKRVIGWRAMPKDNMEDAIIVLLNFENHDIEIDLELGAPGAWIRLADIDVVNDVEPEGSASPDDISTLHEDDARLTGFIIPDTAGFIYIRSNETTAEATE